MPLSSLIVAFGILLAIFLGSLVLAKPCRGRANIFLAGLIVSVAVSMSYQALFPSGFYRALPHLTKIYIPPQYLVGPLLFLYVSALAEPAFRFRPLQLVHFAPCALSIAYLVPFFMGSAAAKITFVETRVSPELPTNGEEWVVWLSVQASLWAYTLASLRQYRHHRRRDEDADRILSPFAWRWLFVSLVSVLVILCLFLVVDILMLTGIPLVAFNSVISVSMTLAILFLGWLGTLGLDQISPAPRVAVTAMAPPETVDPAQAVIPAPVPPAVAGEERDLKEGAALFRVVEAAVRKDALFRSAELTLPELAEKLGFSRTELSRIINQGGGMNFYDFLNKLRVEEVQTRLKADVEGRTSVLQVAFEAGFNTKSTFHTSFKKWTGVTPSAYRKQVAVVIDSSP